MLKQAELNRLRLAKRKAQEEALQQQQEDSALPPPSGYSAMPESALPSARPLESPLLENTLSPLRTPAHEFAPKPLPPTAGPLESAVAIALPLSNEWKHSEILRAAQGFVTFGRNFNSVAEHVATKSATQIRKAYLAWKRTYGLDFSAGNFIEPLQAMIDGTLLGDDSLPTGEPLPPDYKDDTYDAALMEPAPPIPTLASQMSQLSTAKASSSSVASTEEAEAPKKRPMVSYWTSMEKALFVKALRLHALHWPDLVATIGSKSETQIRNLFVNTLKELGLPPVIDEQTNAVIIAKVASVVESETTNAALASVGINVEAGRERRSKRGRQEDAASPTTGMAHHFPGKRSRKSTQQDLYTAEMLRLDTAQLTSEDEHYPTHYPPTAYPSTLSPIMPAGGSQAFANIPFPVPSPPKPASPPARLQPLVPSGRAVIAEKWAPFESHPSRSPEPMSMPRPPVHYPPMDPYLAYHGRFYPPPLGALTPMPNNPYLAQAYPQRRSFSLPVNGMPYPYPPYASVLPPLPFTRDEVDEEEEDDRHEPHRQTKQQTMPPPSTRPSDPLAAFRSSDRHLTLPPLPLMQTPPREGAPFSRPP